MEKIFTVLMVLFFSIMLLSFNAFAEERGNKEPGIFSRENPYKTGIIFNVDDILLDVESYQGGIGLKRYFKDQGAYRVALDFEYSNSFDSLLVSLGNTLEYHIITGRISPYIGGYFDIGYARYKDETDSDNWTKSWSIPLSTGPVFGVEIEVFNVLSLFAEYSLAFDLTYTTTTTSIAGSETTDSTTNYSVDTGLGNDSKIGIVIYFNRVYKKNKKD